MHLPSPIPDRKLYESEAVHEIFSSGLALLGVILQVISTAQDKLNPSAVQKLALAMYSPDRDEKLLALGKKNQGIDGFQLTGWILTLVGIILLFYLKYRRGKAKDVAESQSRNPEGLRGCAMVLYSMVKKLKGLAADDGSIRVTVYRVTPTIGDEDPELEQVIDYVGAPASTGKARRASIHAGVIGLAARTGEAQVANRVAEEDAEYKKELVETWGYTQPVAEKMSMDRKAFIAVPIMDTQNQVIGVVFADSSVDSAFDDIEEEFVAAALGFAAYVEERFK